MPKSKTSLEEMLYEIRRIEQSREILTEKKIAAMYQQLTDDLDAFLAKGYKKYADSDGRLYISYLDAQRKRAWFLNEIVKNVDNLEPSLKREITKQINTAYEECYKGMVEAVKKADTADKLANATKDIAVRPEVLKQAVNNNISKLTLPAVLEKHRAEIIYQIQNELTIGLMNGDRYEKMSKRISERLNVSEGKAKNIVRTETHRNIESGFMDCAEDISKGLDGSNLIYAATWRTMKDERVRPQQRRRTKKGWKTTISSNGANHIVMEDKTVKVGEMFDLGEGIKAKAPSQSGHAKHDCNCRCFLEYNLLTVEEFAQKTHQTTEQVKEKYDISTVKEKDLTKQENSVNIELPKSLEHFDEYQKQWVDSRMFMSTRNKEILQNGIKEVIDNNAYSMRVNAKDLQSIIDGGFKNQFETKTSGGTLSKRDRMTASYRLFGNEATKMADSEFEKYGYLGSMDFVADYKSSASSQYGKTIVKFKKDKLKDRVTYTVDDSLGNALYNEVIGGKIGDECSISGIPLFNTDDLLEYFKNSDWNDIDNADELAQLMGCRYWEIQFHGKLSIDDVDSICLTKTDRDKATDGLIKQLKDHDVKVYEIRGRGNELHEL